MSDDQKKDQDGFLEDLGEELREMGRQLQDAVATAVTSDRARSIQRDLTTGLRELGSQVKQGLQTIKEDPRLHEFAERGQNAIGEVQENPQVKELQDAVTRGLAQLNEQLSTLVTRMRDELNNPPAGPTQVNIERDESTTGDTTKLDQ